MLLDHPLSIEFYDMSGQLVKMMILNWESLQRVVQNTGYTTQVYHEIILAKSIIFNEPVTWYKPINTTIHHYEFHCK